MNKNFKRNYYTSFKNKCYWKTLLNRLYNNEVKITSDMQYIKINKFINKSIKENNINLFNRYYFQDGAITRYQYEFGLANTNKEYIALQHPLVLIKLDNYFVCIIETSQKIANIKKSLILEEFFKDDITALHKADRLTIKEFNGKYYVLAFRKFENHEALSIFKEVENLKVLSIEEKKDFIMFLNDNLEILKKNIINMDNYYNPELMLKIIVDFNLKNNFMNKDKGEL